MLSDPRQDLSEVEFRVQPVELGAADERVDRRGPISTRIGTCEKVVAPSESDGAQGALGARVVDFDQPIVDISREGAPA